MLARLIIGVGFWVALAVPAGASISPSFDARLADAVEQATTIGELRNALAGLRNEAEDSDQMRSLDAFDRWIELRREDDETALSVARSLAAAEPRNIAAQVVLARTAVRAQRYAEAADAIVASSSAGSRLVDAIPDPVVAATLAGLRREDDRQRIGTVSAALLGAGWSRGSVATTSALIVRHVRDLLESGQLERASTYVERIEHPSALYRMLADRAFAPFHSVIVEQHGSRLEKAWRRAIDRARVNYQESGEARDAVALASLLREAGLHQAVLDQFLGRFVRGYNCARDPVARAVAPLIVASLVDLGRLTRAERVLARLGKATGGVDLNRLSLIYLQRGKFRQAQRMLNQLNVQLARHEEPPEPADRALLDARAACIAHRLGQEASVPDLSLLPLNAQLFTLQCLGESQRAKNVLIGALADRDQRSEAILFLQPAVAAESSPFEIELRAAREALRRDTDVRAALEPFGRIMAWPPDAGAPDESQVMRAKPPRRRRC